jgi:putative ABC transport system substrate-binding protein
MMQRRCAVLLIVAIAAGFPSSGWTQQAGRLQKLAILSPGKQVDVACLPNNQGGGIGYFLEALRALGYIDGRNIALEYRFAEGASERLPALAAELVNLMPDVIYTYTTGGATAAAGATTTIPVVVGPAAERTFERLAGNFARPVGNVTGLTLSSPEQDQKCLQLLKELAPRTSRVALMVNPDNPNFGSALDLLRSAASQLGLTLTRIEARNASELPQAFAMIRASGADAILLADEVALAGTSEVRKQILDWARGRGLPVASSSSRVAADGGLVSFGTDDSELVGRAAFYVHRILGGARPAELPVERPMTFKLSVNRKTASALGLVIPQSLQLRADEVIQ